MDLSRSTTSAVSLIWTGRDAGSDRYGSSGWPRAAARPWSSATGATRTSTAIALDGVRGRGTGKPDEIKRLTSGLGRGRRKSAGWQLADALLYCKHGSEGAGAQQCAPATRRVGLPEERSRQR